MIMGVMELHVPCVISWDHADADADTDVMRCDVMLV